MNQQEARMDWVSLETCGEGDSFREEGGIYAGPPKRNPGHRTLDASERQAACPRCGRRFAASEEMSAEECRDLHYHGDEDLPSICANLVGR